MTSRFWELHPSLKKSMVAASRRLIIHSKQVSWFRMNASQLPRFQSLSKEAGHPFPGQSFSMIQSSFPRFAKSITSCVESFQMFSTRVFKLDIVWISPVVRSKDSRGFEFSITLPEDQFTLFGEL